VRHHDQRAARVAHALDEFGAQHGACADDHVVGQRAAQRGDAGERFGRIERHLDDPEAGFMQREPVIDGFRGRDAAHDGDQRTRVERTHQGGVRRVRCGQREVGRHGRFLFNRFVVGARVLAVGAHQPGARGDPPQAAFGRLRDDARMGAAEPAQRIDVAGAQAVVADQQQRLVRERDAALGEHRVERIQFMADQQAGQVIALRIGRKPPGQAERARAEDGREQPRVRRAARPRRRARTPRGRATLARIVRPRIV
jgi:hypothetical protein